MRRLGIEAAGPAEEDPEDEPAARRRPASATSGASRSASGGPLKEYRITLTPGPDTLRRGINPLGTFDELRELGETRIETDMGAVPALDDLDPERCYLSWTITLETAVDVGQIREVFLFFTEDSTVTIERRAEDGGWSRVRMDESAGPCRPPRPSPRTRPEWSPAAAGPPAAGAESRSRLRVAAAGPSLRPAEPIADGDGPSAGRFAAPATGPVARRRGRTPASGLMRPSSTTWSASPASSRSCPMA